MSETILGVMYPAMSCYMSEGSVFIHCIELCQVMEVILHQPACKVDIATESEGYTALHMAASKGSVQVFPLLFLRPFPGAHSDRPWDWLVGFACPGVVD